MDKSLKNLLQSKNSDLQRLMLVTAVRVGFLTAILILTFVLQFRNSTFLSPEVLIPLYFILFCAYFANTAYIYLFDTVIDRLKFISFFFFLFDGVFVTALIYYTGVSQSIFLFLYLVNISLAGFVFQRQGAYWIALASSVFFSFLLLIGPELRGQTLYYAVGLNNLAFFTVAALSGYLSEHLNFMGQELVEREEKIHELEDLNQLVIENISTGLMTVSLNGRIVQANRSALEILGIEKPIGQSIDGIFSGFGDLIQQNPFQFEGAQARRYEIKYVRGEETMTLGLSLSALMAQSNEISGYILIFQDVTQIKRLEAAVRRSEKLAAVGQLAAGIAHEIRNPLASMSGSIQLLKDNLKNVSSSSEDLKLMNIVLREVDRLNTLITEFLDFVRPEKPADQRINVGQLVQEVAEMMRLNTKLRSDIELNIDLKTEQPVLGQSDKLKQVLINLFVNAYQAMENTPQPVLRVKYFFEEPVAILQIQDNGPGMNADVLSHLFEPFHTTKTGGTGLGLAMVHKIVENHEAQILVDSLEGRGTTFEIRFHRLAYIDATPHQKQSDDEKQKLALQFQEEMKKFNLRKRGHG